MSLKVIMSSLSMVFLARLNRLSALSAEARVLSSDGRLLAETDLLSGVANAANETNHRPIQRKRRFQGLKANNLIRVNELA
ncbi:unnamed protein product [Protopolystoma xenopodis]|uniref:Secreted protein n=1 Tax=Protopolystoma xenopodis TaxID=117903 RepID=A0A3S5CVS8_9PLAT|nr:unnamed protein product [Protopolystoma xenopodis]